MNISQLFGFRPVSFYPQLRKITGSIPAAIMLQQLLYWWDRRNGETVYKTIEEIEEETSLSRYEQDGAIRLLKKAGFVVVERKGLPAKRHFRLDVDAINKALTSLLETSNTVCGEPANQFVEIPQSNTETTTETTTENSPLICSPHSKNAKKETPRQVLEHVLSPEDAAAVIEHRQRLRKPLTPRAAKILANAFSEIEPDKRSEAVDMMIVSGWTGFKAEWFNNRQQNSCPSSGADMQPSEELAERVMGMMQGRLGRHSMIAIIKWAISRRSFLLSKDVDAVIVEIGMLVSAIEDRLGEDAVDEIMALAIEDLTNDESGAKLNAEMIMQRYNSMLREWRGRTKEVYGDDGVRFETVLTPEGERLRKRIAERFGNNLLEHDSDGE